MANKAQLYQAATLAAAIIFSELMERLRPGHPVDKAKNLSLNFLALLITASAGEVWKEFLLEALKIVYPGRTLFSVLLQVLNGTGKVILSIVLADFCLYWVHRAMHRKTLWRTHMFHHSIDELWWLSGSRTSLTHLLLFAVPQVLIGYYLLQFTPFQAGAAFSFGVVVNIWIHTNIWVNLGPLEWILITPNYHRIHHGSKGLSSRNLGFVLTIWDRMFGTYVNPQSIGRDFPLGFVSTRKRLLRLIVGI